MEGTPYGCFFIWLRVGFAACCLVYIALDTVIRAIACGNERGVGVFALNARKVSVGDKKRVALFKLDSVHIYKPFFFAEIQNPLSQSVSAEIR